MRRPLSKARILARGIVPHLPGWHVRASGDDFAWGSWAELGREDGACIRITVGGYKAEKRVTFRGHAPDYEDGNRTFAWGSGSPTITCNVERSPESMAKDILRRLLPVYDPKYAEALAYVRKSDANAREAQMVAERIAGTIGGSVGPNRARFGDGVAIHEEPDAVRRLQVRAAYNENPCAVDFEVHGLDPEVAARVLTIIREAELERIEARVRVSDEVQVEHEEQDEGEHEARATKRLRLA